MYIVTVCRNSERFAKPAQIFNTIDQAKVFIRESCTEYFDEYGVGIIESPDGNNVLYGIEMF